MAKQSVEVLIRVSTETPVHVCPNGWTRQACDYALCNDCKLELTPTEKKTRKVKAAEKLEREKRGLCTEHHCHDLMMVGDGSSFTSTYYNTVLARGGKWPSGCSGVSCKNIFIKVATCNV